MEEREEKVDEQAFNLYKPLLHAPPPPQVELVSIDQCEVAPELDDLQLVGVPVEVSVPADVAAGEGELAVDVEVHVSERSGGKRRRGRPPRFQAGAPARAPPKKKDEEDVCFICFDGGSLVLCDRRGCPKAYHPACIKRDEAFFRSKAKWNCGWHICSSCQKAAHYMCYTCTYSLCKACTKDADYLCVRSNKGFCGICMRTIMLIENNVPGNEEMVQVDFDDKGSWEYLFKVYWIYLKEKLSLTVDELARAKNPWKGDVIMARKRERFGGLCDGKDGKGFNSNGFFGDLEPNNSKRRKTNEQSNFLKKETLNIEKPSGDSVRTLPEGMGWASKELLEFVAHVKNGDTSVMSQFDVQNLLLEYIKRNDLRDPCQKCQILCDMRLVNLFGKACVGHFEMLKLLEYHFLIKENPQIDSIIQEGVVDGFSSQVEPHGNNDNQLMMGNKKRRKIHKKHDEKGPQLNLDEYAAIDVHNINLIYLRRTLMENLIDGTDKFHDKVVGSIVRIKISSSDQKEDMHRLVQVVGTSKVAEPYQIGNNNADIMLEILNLDKKEAVSIDGISNHEFSEDECGRLRQSIKCGLIKRLTVGEIQAKAMALRAVRFNDWLETEILRLNCLRDRASEHGHRKEFRECVEKLQHLNSLEERQRRLHEIPEVHADPNMDPKFESEDFGESDDKKQDDKMGARGGDILKDGGNRAQNPIDSVTGGSNNQAVVRSQLCSGTASETSLLPLFTGMTPSANDDCNDNLWHYQDPSGKIQGPFSLVQLCKWSTSGHFPPDLRIWRINEKQNDSMLLTDALNGQGQKKQPLVYSNHLLSQEARVASDCKDNNWAGEWSGSMNASRMKNSKKEGSWNSTRNDANSQSNGNNDFARSSGWDSCSSSWTAPADIINSSVGQSGSFVLGWGSSKINNSLSGQSQDLNSLPSCTLPEKPFEKLSNQGRECREAEAGSSGLNNGDLNSHKATESQTNSGQSYEKQRDGRDHAGQSSGQNWRHPPINSSNSEFVFEGNPVETSQQNQEIDFPDLPSPTPKPGDEDSKDRAAENKQSPSSNLPVQESGLSWSTASSLVGGGAHVPEVAGEWGAHSPAPEKPPVEEWDSNIMSATSLKLSEMASDHAATPTSGTDQLTHLPPVHLESNTSSWQAFATGPDEFSTLDDESVSDLLAEYEAMETLAGMASPTSIMYCGGDFTQASKNDCFSSVEDFSPVPDPGKSDALSSTGDLQIPSQSAVTDEPHGLLSNTNAFDPQKRSGGQSSTSLEVEADTKLSDVSVNQWEAGSDIRHFAPSTTSLDLAAADTTTWRAGSETTVTSGGPVHGNANFGWGGLAQGNANMVWEAGKGIGQANANVNWSDAGGSPGIWGNQPKYGAERFFAPREHSFQGGDSDFGRGRSLWNRQSFSGGNGGSSPISPPPKGQRVCKYYENGYCKKGASCRYLHP